MTRRSLFGLIAAPAVVPDSLVIQGRTGPRTVFGQNLNKWMFIDFRRDEWGDPLGWCLSHRPTGLALVTCVTRYAAVQAAAAMLPLTNWDCTQEDVKTWPESVRAQLSGIRYEAEGWDWQSYGQEARYA